MTHTPTTHGHADSSTKPSRPRLSLQERKDRDNALVRAANALEVKARDLLHTAHAAEVEEVEQAHRRNSHNKTCGPVRLALRTLARDVKHAPTLAVYREADALYWALVLHWSDLLAAVAKHRANYGGHKPDYLLALYQESAFYAAVRFDPGEIGFSTYMWKWALAREGRDPETATVIRGPLSNRWTPERVQTVPLDGSPKVDAGEGAGLSWAELLADDQPDPLARVMASMDREWLATLDAHLPHEQRVVLATLYDDGTLKDAGDRLGISREGSRQHFFAIRAKVSPCRDDARANLKRVPCRWPRCRREVTHQETGLCLDHYDRAKAGRVVKVFQGRVPSVDEVEAAVAKVVAREQVEGVKP